MRLTEETFDRGCNIEGLHLTPETMSDGGSAVLTEDCFSVHCAPNVITLYQDKQQYYSYPTYIKPTSLYMSVVTTALLAELDTHTQYTRTHTHRNIFTSSLLLRSTMLQ